MRACILILHWVRHLRSEIILCGLFGAFPAAPNFLHGNGIIFVWSHHIQQSSQVLHCLEMYKFSWYQQHWWQKFERRLQRIITMIHCYSNGSVICSVANYEHQLFEKDSARKIGNGNKATFVYVVSLFRNCQVRFNVRTLSTCNTHTGCTRLLGRVFNYLMKACLSWHTLSFYLDIDNGIMNEFLLRTKPGMKKHRTITMQPVLSCVCRSRELSSDNNFVTNTLVRVQDRLIF